MCCFEMVFEIGECLHILSHILVRRGILCVRRTEVSHEAHEEAFGGTHRLKRNMHNVMPEAARHTANLVEQERAEIDVREDEFNMFDFLVETYAKRREEARAAPRFIVGEREKTDEEPKRNKNRNKICHDG